MEKRRIIMILFLVVVVVSFVPRTFAIFRSVFGGNGSLTGAIWSVALNQENVNEYLSVVPDPNGSAASYTVNITSTSKVNVTYSIVVDNLPSGVSVSVDGGQYVQESNNKVVLSNVGAILYNDENKSRAHVLSFKAASGTQTVTDNEVDIDVVVKQQL